MSKRIADGYDDLYDGGEIDEYSQQILDDQETILLNLFDHCKDVYFSHDVIPFDTTDFGVFTDDYLYEGMSWKESEYDAINTFMRGPVFNALDYGDSDKHYVRQMLELMFDEIRSYYNS